MMQDQSEKNLDQSV